MFARRTFIVIIPAGLLIVFAALLHAADKETVTLDVLIEELLKNNPQIQAAESGHRAALARPSQARTLPDPLVSFVARNASGNPLPFTKLGEEPGSSVGLMWEQEIPYPGKLKLAGRIAEKEADSIGARVEEVRWDAIAMLKQAFYEYYRAQESIEILSESRALLKRFEDIAQSRYSVGDAIQQDVLRAQVEVSIVDQRITTLQQQHASAAAQINRLLNRSPDAPLPKAEGVVPTPVSATLEELQSEVAPNAPQISGANAIVDRERLSLDLAKKQYRPDFMTMVEYANSPNFPDMWQIRLGLRIPLFARSKQRYGVIESTQNVNRAQKELDAARQQVSFNVKDAYLQIQSSGRLLDLYQQAIIPQSSLALESGIASYQVGKADFLTTISNFLTLLAYRMNYYEELAKHEIAIARLEQAVGRSLSSNGRNQ